MSTSTPTDLILVSRIWRVVERLTDRAVSSKTPYNWADVGRIATSGERIYLETKFIDNHLFTTEEWVIEFLEMM